ncbi:alpha-mannosidase [Streptomyces sp. NPDC059922]|uniref:alpha-mannosidase n=1 Tax=Streptomyces sp. NPDC059922 TaxID=3347005 RepID=UPI00366243A9
MYDRRNSGEARISHFLAARLRPALYTGRLPMDISAWHIPGEPVPVDVALRADYTPFFVGDAWGRPWSTSWFQVHATVPQRWAGERVEAVFDLGFEPGSGFDPGPGLVSGPGVASGPGLGGPGRPGSRAVGLVHDPRGTPLQGLHRLHRSMTVSAPASGGEPVRLFVEAAANPPIDAATGAGAHYGDPVTAGDEPLYRLLRADLAVRDEGIWQLIHDIDVLDGLMRALPAELPRRYAILRALEEAVDAVDPRDVAGTAPDARRILAPVLARRAHESAHTVSVVGRAPLGAAVLGPARESVRETARAFSTLAALAEEYPELTVAAPAAHRYAWMKDRHPDVFERVRKSVADGNWVPVGGMWAEPDGNLPGGEALARQFVYGRRFHREELGTDTDGVWLPGASGLSAAFPQLAVLAGARWFLAERSGPVPHPAVWWEGIDGTRILSHFPPASALTHDEPAGGELDGAELARAAEAFADQGDAARSLVPLGHADGYGPTPGTLERARRLADLEGSPRVASRHPAHFFRDALGVRPDAPVWRGEFRQESHHGTYTSQARTKRGNRRAESLLREAELWSATAAVRDGVPYPYDELDTLWKKVLLQQSHDLLSGTSTAWAHQEAEHVHREVHRRLERLIRRAVGTSDGGGATGASVFNAGPLARREVVVLDRDRPTGGGQRLSDGRVAVLAEAPALGRGAVVPAPSERAVTGPVVRGRVVPERVIPEPVPPEPDGVAPVTVRPTDGGGWLLDNGLLRVHVDAEGLVRSMLDLATGREAVAPGAAGNLLRLHRDDPPRWSARDLDARHRGVFRDLDRAESVEVSEEGALLAAVRVVRNTGRSAIGQTLSLTAGSRSLTIDTEIDWRERDALLKAVWPLDVHAEHSRAEVQFGHVARPTHENSGGDAARCELWAHRWIHVGEHGWGVALAGDATYGYDVSRHTREDAGTTTTVRLTLLRAAHSPDPHADRGPQRFRHSVRPGAGVGDAIAEGYAISLPLRPGPSEPAGSAAPPLVSVDHPDVLVEAVKLADDRSGDVVVRLYESRGGRARTALSAAFPVASVCETDLLEEPLAARPCENGSVALTLRPFQILTLRLTPGDRPAAGRTASSTGRTHPAAGRTASSTGRTTPAAGRPAARHGAGGSDV